MANQDTSAALLGSGLIDANVVVDVISVPVDLDGSLSSSVQTGNYVNTYVALYGFLLVTTQAISRCYDLVLDIPWQIIDSTKCSVKGSSVAITRYRGDTYPVTLKAAPNGNPDITGHTFKMSMQIASGTIYEVAGTITSAPNGEVEFVPNPTAIAVAGIGVYDIEGNDGTYTYTLEKGVLTILDDLTV